MAATHRASLLAAWGPNWETRIPQLRLPPPDKQLVQLALIATLFRSAGSASDRINQETGMSNARGQRHQGVTLPLLKRVVDSRRVEIANNGGAIPWEITDPAPPAGTPVRPPYVVPVPAGYSARQAANGRQQAIILSAQGLGTTGLGPDAPPPPPSTVGFMPPGAVPGGFLPPFFVAEPGGVYSPWHVNVAPGNGAHPIFGDVTCAGCFNATQIAPIPGMSPTRRY